MSTKPADASEALIVQEGDAFLDQALENLEATSLPREVVLGSLVKTGQGVDVLGILARKKLVMGTLDEELSERSPENQAVVIKAALEGLLEKRNAMAKKGLSKTDEIETATQSIILQLLNLEPQEFRSLVEALDPEFLAAALNLTKVISFSKPDIEEEEEEEESFDPSLDVQGKEISHDEAIILNALINGGELPADITFNDLMQVMQVSNDDTIALFNAIEEIDTRLLFELLRAVVTMKQSGFQEISETVLATGLQRKNYAPEAAEEAEKASRTGGHSRIETEKQKLLAQGLSPEDAEKWASTLAGFDEEEAAGDRDLTNARNIIDSVTEKEKPDGKDDDVSPPDFLDEI